MRITGGKGADVVYDPTGNQSSYNQSSAAIASGGEYIRLGTEMQLKLGGTQDMTSVVEGRGAKMLIADLGRYSMVPQYKAQMGKVYDGQRQAVKWYTERKLKPVITKTIPLDAAALKQEFGTFMQGVSNVGKVVVKCNSKSV